MKIQPIHNLEFMKLDGLDSDVQQNGHIYGPSPFQSVAALLAGVE
jgi:hypothetical protein